MSFSFNSMGKTVLVNAELRGPTNRVQLILALDTGATRTVIGLARLVAAGYDPTLATTQVQMTTGSQVVTVPLLAVKQLSALGQIRLNLSVIGHTLPPTASMDGLLGLDFFRGHILTLDFVHGQITLA
jgi:hypothetical protein